MKQRVPFMPIQAWIISHTFFILFMSPALAYSPRRPSFPPSMFNLTILRSRRNSTLSEARRREMHLARWPGRWAAILCCHSWRFSFLYLIWGWRQSKGWTWEKNTRDAAASTKITEDKRRMPTSLVTCFPHTSTLSLPYALRHPSCESLPRAIC